MPTDIVYFTFFIMTDVWRSEGRLIMVRGNMDTRAARAGNLLLCYDEKEDKL